MEGDVAVVTLDSPPVKALSSNVRDGLFAGFAAAIEDPIATEFVLICAGRTFIAGSDISEFGGVLKGASLLEVKAFMESSTKPVVVAIHGTALGEWLEVALCAHYRIAVPSAKCGLPEVNLGLLPGAGGTQRLPRIAGPRRALEMMMTGTHVSAQECLAMGLINELAREGDLYGEAVSYARRVVAGGAPLAKISDRPVEPMSADEFVTFRAANAKRFRGFKAPEAIVQTVEAAVNLPFAEGTKVERELFTRLVTSPESAAQRYVFFGEREVRKIPDVPPSAARATVAYRSRMSIAGWL